MNLEKITPLIQLLDEYSRELVIRSQHPAGGAFPGGVAFSFDIIPRIGLGSGSFFPKAALPLRVLFARRAIQGLLRIGSSRKIFIDFTT